MYNTAINDTRNLYVYNVFMQYRYTYYVCIPYTYLYNTDICITMYVIYLFVQYSYTWYT